MQEEEHKEEEVSSEEKTLEEKTSTASSPAKKYAIIAVIVVAIAGVAFVYARKTTPNTTTAVLGTSQSNSQRPPRGANSGGGKASLVGQKFSDSQLFNNAYLIAPGDLSADAKTAADGFDIQKQQMGDGSVEVTLVPTNSKPDYQQQSFVVKPGYKLYFVELSHGDDRPSNTDSNLRDDFGVLVDQSGTVIK